MACTKGQPHERPVHFNLGRNGHVWACLSCGRNLSGIGLSDDELAAIVEFLKYLESTAERQNKGVKTMNVSVTVTGASRVDLVKNLRAFADNLDGSPADPSGKVVATKKGGKKAAAASESFDEDDDKKADESFDDDDTEVTATADEDDDTEVAASDDDDEDFAAEPAPKKEAAKKGKKVTLKEVNAACAARAKFAKKQGKDGRATVLKILKAKFKTETISTIKEEMYPKVIEAMAVSQ